jgi:hypothetical protein
MTPGQRVRIPSGPTGLVPRHNLTGVVIGRCECIECDDWDVLLDTPAYCACDGSTRTVICEAEDNMVPLEEMACRE